MTDLSTCKVQRTLASRLTAEELWNILTNPVYTRKYMFSTAVTSDWVIGSPITWAGIHQGREAGGKGKIINAEPGLQLKYSSFNTNDGLLDIAENYLVITYDISPAEPGTSLVITIENFNGDPDRCAVIARDWDTVVIPELSKLI